MGGNSGSDDGHMGLEMFPCNSVEGVEQHTLQVRAAAPAPVAAGQDTAIQPWMSRESMVEVILERPHTARDLHQWIFDQLDTYSLSSGSTISSANVVGSPGGLEVYKRNLSYNENKQRKLFSSNTTELQSKAYIVDDRASKPLVSSRDDPGPSYLNKPGVKENIQLCPCPPGDDNSRLAYLGGAWLNWQQKKETATGTAPLHGTERSSGKKAKTTTQPAAISHRPSTFAESHDAAEEDFAPALTGLSADAGMDADLNPDNIKVWGFYRVTGEVLKKIERLCKQPNRRAVACKQPENNLSMKDLGPTLCIVLPSSYDPVYYRNVLRKRLKREAMDKIARMMNDRFGANIPLTDEHTMQELQESLLDIFFDNDLASVEDSSGPGIAYASSASPHRSINIGASVCEVTSDPGLRKALIWAVSKYDGAQELPNAIEDGVRLRSMLRKLGWKVTLLTDVRKATAQESLTEFRDLVENNSNACLFAFVGHGLESGGKNYLVPSDAKLPFRREADLKDLCIPFEEVTKMLAEVQNCKKKPAHTIFVLDCCRSDAFGTSGPQRGEHASTSGSQRGGQATSLQSNVKNSLIVYSTTSGHTATDGRPGEGGPFMRAFTKYAEIAGDEINSVLNKTRVELQSSTRYVSSNRLLKSMRLDKHLVRQS
jgi:hypothetical protein